MSASTLRWPLFALIGLLVAVAVALLAIQLVSERIGISAEPLTVGESSRASPSQAERGTGADLDGFGPHRRGLRRCEPRGNALGSVPG